MTNPLLTTTIAVHVDQPRLLAEPRWSYRNKCLSHALLELLDEHWRIAFWPSSKEVRDWARERLTQSKGTWDRLSFAESRPEGAARYATFTDLVPAGTLYNFELTPQFLPCVDDHELLSVMADHMEEQGEGAIVSMLRWTAREWEWGRGLRREQCIVGLPVWARFGSQGWSRGTIASVTARHITVAIDRRMAKRAWWDLVSASRPRSKPKPRRGYGSSTNAKLAAALTGAAAEKEQKQPTREQQRTLLDLTLLVDDLAVENG